MKPIRIKLDVDYKNVDIARKFIHRTLQDFFKNRDFKSQIDDICLAATEAMNNAVEHSCSPFIEIELAANETEILFNMITEGERFDPTVITSMPDINNMPVGGFGLSIIQELTDSVHYEYQDGKNILILRKTLLDKNKEE